MSNESVRRDVTCSLHKELKCLLSGSFYQQARAVRAPYRKMICVDGFWLCAANHLGFGSWVFKPRVTNFQPKQCQKAKGYFVFLSAGNGRYRSDHQPNRETLSVVLPACSLLSQAITGATTNRCPLLPRGPLAQNTLFLTAFASLSMVPLAIKLTR